jgi:hypothetical protein
MRIERVIFCQGRSHKVLFKLDRPQKDKVGLRIVREARAFDEDVAFNSHPILGVIAYRLPALDTLIGVPMNYLDKYLSMTFYLTVMADDELGQEILECGNANKCRIIYNRFYSPVLYYV